MTRKQRTLTLLEFHFDHFSSKMLLPLTIHMEYFDWFEAQVFYASTLPFGLGFEEIGIHLE